MSAMVPSSLSDEQLVHTVLGHELEIVRARFKHSMNQLENTSSLKELRRGIARLRTEARRREIESGLKPDALFDQHRSSFAVGGPTAAESTPTKGGFLSGIVDKLTGKE